MFAAPPPAPTAIAFRDPGHGVLGTTRDLELTSDGGRTWHVVLRTERPVASLSVDPDGSFRAVLDDGENLGSADGRRWAPVRISGPTYSPCEFWAYTYVNGTWAICAGQGAAGNAAKAVFHQTQGGWRRGAYTGPGRSRGGISMYGYAEGISVAADGFGLIWESRGTLYVTRDNGAHWVGLPHVARPELDFGSSAAALSQGVGFVLLYRVYGGGQSRLIETTDAGRTWHVVHRWRS